MIRLKPLTTAALLAGLLASGAAIAQDAPPPPAPPQDDAGGPPPDRPGPGMMMMMMRGPGPVLDFVAIDTDGNGILTREELTARATARLATADSNHDGALQRDELIAAMPAPRNLMMVFAPDPAAEHADRLLDWMGSTNGQIEIAALADRQVNGVLAWIDTNHDGAISKAEADAAADHGPRQKPGRHGPGGHDHDDNGDGPRRWGN